MSKPSVDQLLMLGTSTAATAATATMCLIACIVPARRALAVELTEALRHL